MNHHVSSDVHVVLKENFLAFLRCVKQKDSERRNYAVFLRITKEYFMRTKHLLDRAKAFLCWDMFPDLTIKLVPLQHPTAFYYPPSATFNTIVVFYPVQVQDFSPCLFLLFHEAGHYLQFREYRQQGREQQFWEMVNMNDGPQKINFERDSWQQGAELLSEFLLRNTIDSKSVMAEYQIYAEHCLESYRIRD